LATIPSPIVMMNAVPNNSAIKGVIYFNLKFKLYIKLRKNKC
jgi:hypothetical protein